jgi:hypothetical protein
MVFVLDNYDSFTYNLVQYLGELGAEVEVYRNDELTVEQVEALKPERILLSPGPCTPGEAGILVPLIRAWPGKPRFLASAWVTRPSAKRLAATWCARTPDARQDQRRSSTTATASSPACRPRSPARAIIRSSSRRTRCPPNSP